MRNAAGRRDLGLIWESLQYQAEAFYWTKHAVHIHLSLSNQGTWKSMVITCIYDIKYTWMENCSQRVQLRVFCSIIWGWLSSFMTNPNLMVINFPLLGTSMGPYCSEASEWDCMWNRYPGDLCAGKRGNRKVRDQYEDKWTGLGVRGVRLMALKNIGWIPKAGKFKLTVTPLIKVDI